MGMRNAYCDGLMQRRQVRMYDGMGVMMRMIVMGVVPVVGMMADSVTSGWGWVGGRICRFHIRFARLTVHVGVVVHLGRIHVHLDLFGAALAE